MHDYPDPYTAAREQTTRMMHRNLLLHHPRWEYFLYQKIVGNFLLKGQNGMRHTPPQLILKQIQPSGS